VQEKALAVARALLLCENSAKALLLCGVGLGCVALGVLAAEALHATGRVEQFLLAGEERVATGADFYVQIAFVGGPGYKIVAARANHADFAICGMDGCFHVDVRPRFPTV
jgi:hypothetical protein